MTPWADGCRGRASSSVVVTTLAEVHPYPSSAVGMTFQDDRRVTYEARVIITGSEDDARMAAVKFRAFLRRSGSTSKRPRSRYIVASLPMNSSIAPFRAFIKVASK